MVEGTGLENRRTRKGIVGSNPTLPVIPQRVTRLAAPHSEVIRHGGPWRTFDDVEFATLEWVAWFNTCRLMAPLGYLPPAEYEMQFDHHSTASAPAGALN